VADSREEALKLIREAIPLHLEALRQGGSAIPEPASTTEYVQV
jgi:predicted RNase H-like HicB family nuclease